ncbi:MULTISPECIES: chromosome partitioning protein ParA [Enterobacterales]|uniref:chromosome partitioning protein ParA n=1 Tax=Enterobacterales TaxID=91347 RepID=UPI00128FBFE4|nr:chromosome partitioning protein ParA [Escherichia coli]MQK02303.1 chromosome partitioning protein ParA [Escherichia coli]NKD97034.1 chromosome partitioning protein ParA [Escherichia coli]QIG09516.1 chromosome partitioning protein ParA [Escherichia coli]QIG13785.1 chromosome partitioning protein ParA [Escherichia coli]HAX5245506.1 chromosome partitioning protein ParA [Escherichia coli]
MDSNRNNNIQISADNGKGGQSDRTIYAKEEVLLKKQQELKELEYSLGQKETSIVQKEHELKAAKDAIAKKEAELNDKRVQLEEMELQAKNSFPQLFEEKFAAFKKQLEQREAQCVSELESLESEKEKLRQREVAIQKAEIQRDNGYADARAKLDDELFNLRKEHEKELESKRANALTAIEKELSEERTSRIASLEKEIADKLKVHEAAIQQEKDELEQKRKTLLKDQAALDELKDELEYQKQRLQSSKDRLEEREANLNIEVDAKVVERKQSFENEKSALNDEIARLRESIKTSSALISNFEELKYKLGDEDPAAVLLKLKTYEEEIKKLRDDLATRPTQEMREAFDRLKSEQGELQLTCERLSEENEALRSSARAQSDLEMQVAELTNKNKSLLRRFESVDADNNRLMEELKRLQSSYEREQDREARVRDIETPYIHKRLPRAQEQISEIQWLDRIRASCTNYGLRFPRRILYAFHTALKTAEWSPITVLSGVSGTGKSELPRLYSHFGGINFLSLSVQPNWDSQESMLGFFNSIDNKFDAQPVLRLLAQSQKAQTDDYPGLEDVMSLILMDEMNLAHVELYFAEFLSKLELRRGRKGNEVPCLEVKLGVGIQQYDLPLGRNVLWAGTMNQDETTKSLSDKVLDRGIVINFPRPATLERRRQLKPLGEQAPLLSRKLWEGWWCKESKFNDDQILPFKGFIEEMNTSLSKVGRALGHRVWQSIEYYMANYPDVLEAQRNNDDASLGKAMKVAFEDQLVQKVMPKLRGIETRGKSKLDCLDKIRTQLVNDDYNIVEDFDLACEFGYGQFIWNSANYLKDDAFLNESNNNDSRESIVASPEQSNFHSSSKVGDSLIPSELKRFASDNQKKLWQLTTNEIMRAMSCDVKEAKSLKDLCNNTKES